MNQKITILGAGMAGLQSKRATVVATYNARAQMITRDIFRADAPKTVQ